MLEQLVGFEILKIAVAVAPFFDAGYAVVQQTVKIVVEALAAVRLSVGCLSQRFPHGANA